MANKKTKRKIGIDTFIVINTINEEFADFSFSIFSSEVKCRRYYRQTLTIIPKKTYEEMKERNWKSFDKEKMDFFLQLVVTEVMWDYDDGHFYLEASCDGVLN